MPARIVAVAQGKGGSGKTTLAANLAVAWAAEGRAVAAVDVDPQGSLTAWGRLRAGAGLGPPAVETVPGHRLAGQLDRLARDMDVVVLDTPPHTQTEARIAVRAADIVVIPAQPSPLDLWATRATIDLARGEGRPVLLVLSRVPPRGQIADDMAAALAGLGVPLAEARIGNRVAHAEAVAAGDGVVHHRPGSAAAAETRRLAREIMAALG